MNDYIHIYELEKNFKKIMNNTDLHNPQFIHQNNIIQINFLLNNESQYPIKFEKTFDNISELENFITLLENLKTIAENRQYQVQLIPTGVPCSSFDIYINGELAHQNSISHYKQLALMETNAILREKITRDIDAISRQTGKLYQQIINVQSWIDQHCKFKDEIRRNPQSPKASKTKKPTLESAPLTNTKYFQIDLLKIIDLAKQYINSNYNNTTKNALINEYHKIKDAIEKGYYIKTNYWNIPNNFNSEELHILMSFFNNLEQIIKNMHTNANAILEYKKNYLNYIKSSIYEPVKNSTEHTDFETQEPQKYQIFLNHPISSLTFASFSNGKFNLQMNSNDCIFQDIQQQQINKLTQEERDALIYYKSIIYRPINKITALIRKKGISYEEAINDSFTLTEILNIINITYTEYIERKKDIDRSPILFSRRKNPKSVERLFNKFQNQTPTLKQYIDITLSSMPLLISALNKVVTPEDLIVYRGTTGMDLIDDERFLSTTISLNIAKMFGTEIERQNTHAKTTCPTIIQIIIPRGSPVLVYTDDLFTDEYNPNNTFNEEQQEILIDPINFEFKHTYVNINALEDGKMIIRLDYTAIPQNKLSKQIKNS